MSVSPLLLAWSAAAAARRLYPMLEGVPKPRYCRYTEEEEEEQYTLYEHHVSGTFPDLGDDIQISG